MLEKLKEIIAKYEELNDRLSDQAVLADQTKYRALAKEHADLQPIVENAQALEKARGQLAEADQILRSSDDEELKALAEEEVLQLREKIDDIEKSLKNLLSPKDPNDEKNVILEIRAGTGGEEAALFAADIFRMYSRYAESVDWKVETPTPIFPAPAESRK